MQSARVIGNVTATVKHPSLDGWRLIVLQPVDIQNNADGFPVLAIDDLGVGTGDTVFFTSDGSSIRDAVGDEMTVPFVSPFRGSLTFRKPGSKAKTTTPGVSRIDRLSAQTIFRCRNSI